MPWRSKRTSKKEAFMYADPRRGEILIDFMFPLDDAERFNSMQTTAQLVNTLEDTQASLATALARIEAYRIREQHLLDENLKLQEEIRRLTGIDGSMKSSPVKDRPSESQTQENTNYLLHEEYPIVLHTKKGSVRKTSLFRPHSFLGPRCFVCQAGMSGDFRDQSQSRPWTVYWNN